MLALIFTGCMKECVAPLAGLEVKLKHLKNFCLEI
jgi:hypothetical protein